MNHIARVHGASPEAKHLAASGKLMKSARRWYDLATGSVLESWDNFRETLSHRFKRSIPFQVVMQRIEAHKWNFFKESFQDYAAEKLALIQFLKLEDRDTIQYLISGINSRSLRGLATAFRNESLDEFLEEMHYITLTFVEMTKRVPVRIISQTG